MEEKLQKVLNEYIKNVECMCNILIDNINRIENMTLKSKYDFWNIEQIVKKWNLRQRE